MRDKWAAQLDTGELRFARNGTFEDGMGTAFDGIADGEGAFSNCLTPVVSLESSFQCRVNFGDKPLRYPPPAGYRSVQHWVREFVEMKHVQANRARLCVVPRATMYRIVLRATSIVSCCERGTRVLTWLRCAVQWKGAGHLRLTKRAVGGGAEWHHPHGSTALRPWSQLPLRDRQRCAAHHRPLVYVTPFWSCRLYGVRAAVRGLTG